jgi:hypothetical protein
MKRSLPISDAGPPAKPTLLMAHDVLTGIAIP